MKFIIIVGKIFNGNDDDDEKEEEQEDLERGKLRQSLISV